MTKTIRRAALFAVAGMIAALAPIGAKADPAWCESNIVIFSYTGGRLAVNSNVAVCTVLGPDTAPYDGRLINPGSTAISIRDTNGGVSTDPTITAVINGLGYNNQTITLTRTAVGAGPATSYVYDSASLPIDPTATGCITAEVPAEGDPVTGATAFHTLGASC
jgi:hypothetical protein